MFYFIERILCDEKEKPFAELEIRPLLDKYIKVLKIPVFKNKRKNEKVKLLLKKYNITNAVALEPGLEGITGKYSGAQRYQLYRKYPVQIFEAAAGCLSGKTAGIAASAYDCWCENAAAKLIRRCEKLYISIKLGGDILCQTLERGYGISPLRDDAALRCDIADAVLVFSKCAVCDNANAKAIILWQNNSETDGLFLKAFPKIKDTKVSGFEKYDILNVLWAADRIGADIGEVMT